MGAPRFIRREELQKLAEARNPSYSPEAKRILMITASFNRGGAERQMIATASGLVARGYDVRILALELTRPGTPTINDEIARLGIKPEFHTDFFATEGPTQPCFAAEPLLSICQLPSWFWTRAGPVCAAIRHHRPAVVHCWLEMPGIIAAFAACALGVPRVVLGQRYVREYASCYLDNINDFLAAAYPILATHPNVVIVNNSAVGATRYERWFGLRPNTIRVIYNGFAPETMRTPPAQEVLDFRTGLGLDGRNPIVGTLIRFVSEKDPELWLDVAAEIAALRPDVRFLLGGYGEMESIVARRTQALGLADRVILPGVVDDIGLFYAAVDLVLLTSVFEGTPNVLIEAQAAGRPVVAPDVGGVGEAIANGLSGCLVTERSAMHLTEAVLTVLDNPDWKERARIQGPAFIAHRFSVERMIRETLNIRSRKRTQSLP